jgi:hypothetical protein
LVIFIFVGKIKGVSFVLEIAVWMSITRFLSKNYICVYLYVCVMVNVINRALYRIIGKCKKSGIFLLFSFIILGIFLGVLVFYYIRMVVNDKDM